VIAIIAPRERSRGSGSGIAPAREGYEPSDQGGSPVVYGFRRVIRRSPQVHRAAADGTTCAVRRAMIDRDDVRFSSFTRDLARRHRRPRSYPPPPSGVAARVDALEHLCGGGKITQADERQSDSLGEWTDEAPESSVPSSRFAG
jgi:hypothetical protein